MRMGMVRMGMRMVMMRMRMRMMRMRMVSNMMKLTGMLLVTVTKNTRMKMITETTIMTIEMTKPIARMMKPLTAATAREK